ncbi:hypothetical protein FJT64_012306 [Amphibalanus amphitrite]|uniref:Pro-resilin n=1 Tax=Amphibalanus amphitrite TaxID=1232801 RepID=A0A6A4V721_AMPAM|nr:hypothetical protein FJT64_012306 [Amphibalanus amphitrite]
MHWNKTDGTQYSRQESREGANTQGSYRVLLPDTRVMIVNYRVAGDRGYEADVQYQGEAQPYQPPVPGYGPQRQQFQNRPGVGYPLQNQVPQQLPPQQIRPQTQQFQPQQPQYQGRFQGRR